MAEPIKVNIGGAPRVQRGKCRGPNCAADVLFIQNTNSKTVILDAKPVKAYVLVHQQDDDEWSILCDGLDTAPMMHSETVRLIDTYVDHHITCPDRDLFKKKA